MRELRKLFQNMVTASDHAIKPDIELATLALQKKTDAAPRRRSTIGIDHKPSLGQINGVPVLGPLPENADTATLESPVATKVLRNGTDDASEKTLIGDEMTAEPELAAVDSATDKELQSQVTRLDDVMEDVEIPKPVAKVPSAAEGGEVMDKERLAGGGIDEQQDQSKTDALDGPPPPSRPPPIPPRPKQELHPLSVPEEVARDASQQDAQEVMYNVFFQIECALKPIGFDNDGRQWDIVKELFYGKVKMHFDRAKDAVQTQPVEAIYVYVNDGPTDIYTALDGNFDPEEVHTESEGSVLKYESLEKLPPIFSVYVQRAAWDSEAKKSVKVENELKLEDPLYLDRYLESCPLEVRKQSWSMKQRIRLLKDRREELTETKVGLDMPAAIEAAAELLKYYGSEEKPLTNGARGERASADEDDMDIDKPNIVPDHFIEMQEKANELRDELASVTAEIDELEPRLLTLFADMKSTPYTIHSLFMHRGQTGGGHYWIYIRDFERNVWRKYNDSSVDEVADVSKIFTQEEKYPATPSGIIYVREDMKHQLTQALSRKPDLHTEALDIDMMKTVVSQAANSGAAHVLDGHVPEHWDDEGSEQQHPLIEI